MVCPRAGYVLLASALLCAVCLPASGAGGEAYRSPFDAVAAPDGRTVYVADHTGDCVVAVDAAKGAKLAQWPVGPGPTGLALSPDGETLYVALRGADEVAVVATDSGKVARRIAVGTRPCGLALAAKGGRLFVCNTAEATVSMVDLAEGAEKWRVKTVREPMFAALTPDESLVLVSNALPVGPATESSTGAVVSIFDAQTGRSGTRVQLPGGATNCRDIAVSPDGKWAFVVHGVSRFQVPTTQLERGWMNTAGLSVIDVAQRERFATVLLDSVDLGAADPWGLALSPDGKTLWVSLSGTHEVARIEAARLVAMLGGEVPEKYAKSLGSANTNPWRAIKQDPEERFGLVNDLMALYFAELIERFPTTGRRLPYADPRLVALGRGPRGIALSPDGQQLFVPNYFGGTLTALDTERGKLAHTVALGPQPEPDIVRRGERIFHDATLCFQHWQSCATCHPGGRMDGLRWDLLNDGMGNHKKTRSLLFSHRTSPVMSMGVRAKAEVAVRAGFKFILFAVRPEEEHEAVDAYLKSLRPEPSPHLAPDGSLSAAARRGKRLFEGQAKCAECHTGPLYTDLKPYDVGTLGPYDREGDRFYTPKLTELYRIAPYLHDGRAATLRDVLTTCNKKDEHGVTSGLSEKELDDLIAYLLSL
ncbi:MAG: PQQ-binding-like beta-propeller repeat protein [Candidatus Brocadiia bacterium]